MARRSSWKREVDVHQLAGRVILRPLYPFVTSPSPGAVGDGGDNSAGDIILGSSSKREKEECSEEDGVEEDGPDMAARGGWFYSLIVIGVICMLQ
jgi:hypothetical protein